MKYLFITLALLLSSCTKTSLSEEMISSAQKICEKNGKIKFIEVTESKTKSYVACKNQGLVQIDNKGQVSIVKEKEENTLMLESEIQACQEKCSIIKSVNINPFKCECQ